MFVLDISAAEDTEIKVVHAFGLQRSINWEKKAYFHYLSSMRSYLTLFSLLLSRGCHYCARTYINLFLF